MLSLLIADFCVPCVACVPLRMFGGGVLFDMIFICYEKPSSAPDSPYIGMFVSGDFSQSSSQATPISSARGLLFLFRKRTLSSRDTCGSCTLLEPKTKESWHQPSCSNANACMLLLSSGRKIAEYVRLF